MKSPGIVYAGLNIVKRIINIEANIVNVKGTKSGTLYVLFAAGYNFLILKIPNIVIA